MFAIMGDDKLWNIPGPNLISSINKETFFLNVFGDNFFNLSSVSAVESN
jgi:hypothetical protein